MLVDVPYALNVNLDRLEKSYLQVSLHPPKIRILVLILLTSNSMPLALSPTMLATELGFECHRRANKSNNNS